MLAGLDEQTGCCHVMFIGYHARAGAGPAVLAHTISDSILDVRVGGRSLGEIGLNAALAGHLAVPVVLLSGDDSACAEFGELVPSAVTVAVKQSLGQAAAVALHPQEARERLRRAAADAITRRGSIPHEDGRAAGRRGRPVRPLHGRPRSSGAGRDPRRRRRPNGRLPGR